MGLKRKLESGFLALLEVAAGLEEHELFTAEESQLNTLKVPCVAVEAQDRGPLVKDRLGRGMGTNRFLVVVRIMRSADVSSADAPEPGDLLDADRDAVRDVLQVDDLAAQLSATAEEFTVIAAMQTDPPEATVQTRNLVQMLAWECIAAEADL